VIISVRTDFAWERHLNVTPAAHESNRVQKLSQATETEATQTRCTGREKEMVGFELAK